MPLICSALNCKGNYRNGPRVSVFGFPNDEELKIKWLNAMQRTGFYPRKFSRVCELHFEANQIIREASAFDPRTGRTLTAPLAVPRLRKGAVPTLFMPSGTPARSRLDPIESRNKKKKNKPNEKTVNEETKKADGSELAKLLQTDSGTESQIVVAEPAIVIKQEPVESANEASPPPVIKNVLSAEDLTSSVSNLSASNSSSLSISPPIPEKTPRVANPDSVSVHETQITRALNKLPKKRKINDVKEETEDSAPKGFQIKPRRRTKPPRLSKRNRQQTSAGTSNKSTRRTILPTRDAEDGTRAMFQSLINDPENNSSFDSISGEKPGDLFDVFADFIAEKLREMNWDNCAYALRAILDIVFKAGQLQQDSEGDGDISRRNSPSTSSNEE